jgi:hyperosmotically inducible periplasmic protein
LKHKWIAFAVSTAFIVSGPMSLVAQNTQSKDRTAPDKTVHEKAAPDNTKANKTATPTGDKASNAAQDRELMQKIRKSVVDDKTLSTYAHNVKIIAKNGNVTLKGPVRSEEEKAAIERIASDAAGAGNVTNEITIKPETKKGKTN